MLSGGIKAFDQFYDSSEKKKLILSLVFLNKLRKELGANFISKVERGSSKDTDKVRFLRKIIERVTFQNRDDPSF